MDFLCNRKQCVVLNGEHSSWFKVLSEEEEEEESAMI